MSMEAIPANNVVALVKDSATGSAVSAAFIADGLETPLVVSNEMVGQRLSAKSGIVDRTLQTLFGSLSEQGDYLTQYEEAARNGQTVVAVKVTSDDEMRRAAVILEKHGAMDVRFFGRLAVTDLTPESNPSAAST
jgi:hypothetical protein